MTINIYIRDLDLWGKVTYNNLFGQVVDKKIPISIYSESFLKKIHLNRLNDHAYDKALDILMLEIYKKTGDIRFYNELLWNSDDRVILKEAKALFFRQISRSGHYNFIYDDELRFSLSQSATLISDIEFSCLKDKRICLIGKPFHFFITYWILNRHNVDVDVINIRRSDMSQNLTSRLIDSFFLRYIYRLYFKRGNYHEYKFSSLGELKNFKLPQNYDIGFHKLGFIIPQALYSQFKYGLINDHWGALPLFKGRSTLYYTKLFGGKPVITNHFIGDKIDSGQIICFSEINTNHIKRDIYFKFAQRVIKSLFMVFKNGTMQQIDNSKGVIFYEMHPWLEKYTRKNLSWGE
jgi:hypothetical protein